MESRVLLSANPQLDIGAGDVAPPDSAASLTVFPVQATVQTTAGADSADDPAIWIHPSDTSLSLIIGTDKSSLRVYDLAGNELQVLNDGDMNNVDLRYNFPLGGESVALVAASNRTDDTLAFYKVDPAARRLVSVGSFDPNLSVYGLGMYRSAATGKYYVLVNAKSGVFKQLEVFDNGNGQVTATLARTFDIGTQPEGVVADDPLGILYAGEENVGIWKYGAEPDAGDARTLVDDVSSGNLVADVEGMAIYYASDSTGYLLVSSQGSNSFAIYTREGDNHFVGEFNIVAGNGIDEVTATDGIDVTNFPLGATFPQGMFISQDNNVNFKLVPWQAIATGTEPDLTIDTRFDPRSLENERADVVARHVFYNNSGWDGNNAAANSGDDAAIAPDKTALLPGQSATLANYTSFSKGINGVMIDVANIAGAPTAADFDFKTGNVSDIATWTPVATAPSISVRPGVGAGGADRISLIWPDGAIKKQWLQVSMLATGNTGLAAADVFYFGNAMGEAGNSASDAQVNAADSIAARVNPRNLGNAAPITFRYDYNRDRQVNAADQLIARGNGTNLATALRLIAPPAIPADPGRVAVANPGFDQSVTSRQDDEARDRRRRKH